MKAAVYDQKNNKVGTIDLPDNVFKVKWNPLLVQQVLVAQFANRRKTLAHTKGRGEVRGGGRKPWRQKHTGRARHGSSRSPLWAGGGITFGPTKERVFAKKINKKMKKGALFSVLSKKLASDEIRVVEDLNLKDHKTKNLAKIFKSFFKKLPSVLVVPAAKNRNVFLAGRNIPKAKVLNPRTLNVYDCLSHQFIFFEKETIPELIGSSKSK